jgi:predicted ribosomally synthesized peptide with nif11-like leader
MSTKSAKAFLKRMNSDKAFAKRVNECKDAKTRAAVVKAAGYQFSNDELNSLQEVGDEDLSRVVGGAMKAKPTCSGFQYSECC